MNKARVGRKTETGNLGKNAKVGSSFPTGGRLLGVSTSKTSSAPSYKTAQPHKSSARIGVIWIPRRKINKYHKDKVYNPNKNDYSRGDRSPSMYKFMSGDSSNHETQLKNKDDETLLAPEHSGHRESASADAVPELSGLPAPLSRRPGDLFNPDKEDDQQSSNDIDNKSIGSEARTRKDTASEGESKDKLEDKVDSVWLRSPSPHKRAPSASSPSDEGCGLTCLYYTLQCCDCILM